MFNSYLQLELRRQNIWHAGHHQPMANFKSVAYVHKRCRCLWCALFLSLDILRVGGDVSVGLMIGTCTPSIQQLLSKVLSTIRFALLTLLSTLSVW